MSEVNVVTTSIEKLKAELEQAKDKSFAEPIIEYLIERCQEDNGLCEDVCQEHKTWEKCFSYVYECARKFADGKHQCAVRNDVVYEWAEDYYHKDDKAEEEEKARKEEERKQKEAERKEKAAKKSASSKPVSPVQSAEKPKPVEKPAEKISKRSSTGQMSLFDFL